MCIATSKFLLSLNCMECLFFVNIDFMCHVQFWINLHLHINDLHLSLNVRSNLKLYQIMQFREHIVNKLGTKQSRHFQINFSKQVFEIFFEYVNGILHNKQNSCNLQPLVPLHYTQMFCDINSLHHVKQVLRAINGILYIRESTPILKLFCYN